MILIAGATGRLGLRVVRLLVDRGLGVRVIARDPARAPELRQMGAEVLVADINDSDAIDRAAAGARTIVSAISGFGGGRDISPRSVDRDGNRNLIGAAERAGAENFVLLSTYGASPNHPIELFRMKYLAEQSLLASSLTPTILRCTTFMETWAMVLGEPLLKTGRTRIFGRGESPINFVSADDVARFVELAVTDPGIGEATVDIGGPQNLTMNRFVEIFESETGVTGQKSHVPRPVMRVMSRLLRHVNQ